MSSIITKYIIKETLKLQINITLFLFIVFFCQKLIQILEMVISGEIPINSVLILLVLEITEIMKIIFPFSLFLGLIITFNRMKNNNEIIVMQSCGVNKISFFITSLLSGFTTMLFIIINVFWISPYSMCYHSTIISMIKSNPSNLVIKNGKFKYINNRKLVFFIKKISNKKIEQIFLTYYKFKNGTCNHFVIIADYAYITPQYDRSQFIFLKNGFCYNWSTLHNNFKIINFDQYKFRYSPNYLRVNLNSLNPKQMTISKLRNSLSLESSIEIHWRITLILSVLIMSTLAVSLSIIHRRYNLGILYVIGIIFLYLLFFIIQNLFYFNGVHKKINTISHLWIVNILYIFLTILISFCNTKISRKIHMCLENFLRRNVKYIR